MDKQVITKIQRLENKETNSWNEFKLGAEASNIFVRNGNGVTETAQSLLLKNLEPIEYEYGQDIWDANNEVIEQLTWENIQKWLDKGRINDFLKEGDCIIVTTDMFVPEINDNLKYHFYVIGINRHNGQDVNDLGLNHIDFCGGSMVQLGRRFVSNNGLIENGQPGEIEYNFAYLPSNNGREEYNGIYGNYFVDGIFSVENPVKTPVQCLEEICNNVDIPISNKKLYLDARFRPNLAFLDAWANQGLNKTVDTLIADLAAVWENIQQADPVNIPIVLYQGFTNINNDGIFDIYPLGTTPPLEALRVSAEIDQDDFLKDANCDNADFALHLYRYSMGMEDLVQDVLTVGDIDPVLRGENFMNELFRLCKTASKWLTENGGSYSVISKKSINHPSSSIWGLTEKELFGECIFSNAEYAQGQIFQYPIFNDLSFRKKITRDLSHSNDEVCNMVTLTPVENSNTEVAGMDPDTLMPIVASILKTNTYIPDTPICFRIQEQETIIDDPIVIVIK